MRCRYCQIERRASLVCLDPCRKPGSLFKSSITKHSVGIKSNAIVSYELSTWLSSQYGERYLYRIDRYPFTKPFTRKADRWNEEAMDKHVQNEIWFAFYSRSHEKDQWMAALQYAVSFAPSLPSFRYILLHWIHFFIDSCVHNQHSEVCFDRMMSVLQVFPNHVITLPLLEVIVWKIQEALSSARKEGAKKMLEGMFQAIFRPIFAAIRMEDKEKSNASNLVLESARFNLKSRLILTPCLLLEMWRFYVTRTNSMKKTSSHLQHVIHALLRTNEKFYREMYFQKKSQCTIQCPRKPDSTREVWMIAFQLCSITAFTSVISQQKSFTISQNSSRDIQKADWAGYYILRALSRWPCRNKRLSYDAFQFWKKFRENFSIKSETLRWHFLAEILALSPSQAWVQSLREISPKTSSNLSETEIAFLYIHRITSQKRVLQGNQSKKHGKDQTNSTVNHLIPTFDNLLVFLCQFVFSTKFALSEKNRVEKIGGTSIQNTSPCTIAHSILNDTDSLREARGRLMLSSPLYRVKLWISALSVIASADQCHTTWHRIISCLSIHLNIFGNQRDSLDSMVEILEKTSETYQRKADAVHWVSSKESHDKLRLLVGFSSRERSERSSDTISSLLIHLTRRMVCSDACDPAVNLKKMSLAILRTVMRAPKNDSKGRLAPSELSICSALSSVLKILAQNKRFVNRHWLFGLHMLFSLKRSLGFQSSKDFLKNNTTKDSSRRIAYECLDLGLWKAAIAYILFFQSTHLKSSVSSSQGVPTVNSVKYVLSIADHAIVRPSVENILRSYLNSKFFGEYVKTRCSEWERTLKTVSSILRPLRRVEKLLISISNVKLLPTEFYPFNPCFLIQWAQHKVPDHGTFFHVIMSVSPMVGGRLLPRGYFIQYPSKLHSWGIQFRYQNSSTNFKHFTSYHFFTVLQRCLSHSALWQHAFSVLMCALHIPSIDAKTFQKDIEARRVCSYTDLIELFFNTNGRHSSALLLKSMRSPCYFDQTLHPALCLTIMRICEIHSVDITCKIVINVLLPFLDCLVVSHKFWDSMIQTLTQTITRHVSSNGGKRMLYVLTFLCSETLPRKFGYTVTSETRDHIYQAVRVWNRCATKDQFFSFFPQLILRRELNHPEDYSDSLIGQYLIALRRLETLKDIARRQYLGNTLLDTLVVELQPCLTLKYSISPIIILNIMFEYLTICHELPKGSLPQLILLLSASFQAGRRKLSVRQKRDITDFQKAEDKIVAIRRLWTDLRLMYHVQSTVFSFIGKRIEIDSMAGQHNSQDIRRFVSKDEYLATPKLRDPNVSKGRTSTMNVSSEKYIRIVLYSEYNRHRLSEYSIQPSSLRSVYSFFTVYSFTRCPLWKFPKKSRNCVSFSMLPERNSSDAVVANSCVTEKRIFAQLCQILPKVYQAKLNENYWRNTNGFHLDHGIACCYAESNDQLDSKVLLNTIFGGNSESWHVSLSKAQFLKVDLK